MPRGSGASRGVEKVKLEPSARQPVWILDEAAGVELLFFRGTPWKTGSLGMNRSAKRD